MSGKKCLEDCNCGRHTRDKSTYYDWADDDSMSAQETMRRFNALAPVLATGPDPSPALFEM